MAWHFGDGNHTAGDHNTTHNRHCWHQTTKPETVPNTAAFRYLSDAAEALRVCVWTLTDALRKLHNYRKTLLLLHLPPKPPTFSLKPSKPSYFTAHIEKCTADPQSIPNTSHPKPHRSRLATRPSQRNKARIY